MCKQVDGGLAEAREHRRIRQRQAEHLLDQRAEDDVREVDRPVEHEPDVGIGQRSGDAGLTRAVFTSRTRSNASLEERHPGRPAVGDDPPEIARDDRVVRDELVERLPAVTRGDMRRLVERSATTSSTRPAARSRSPAPGTRSPGRGSAATPGAAATRPASPATPSSTGASPAAGLRPAALPGDRRPARARPWLPLPGRRAARRRRRSRGRTLTRPSRAASG